MGMSAILKGAIGATASRTPQRRFRAFPLLSVCLQADMDAWERNPLDTVAFAEALGRADYNLCGGRPLTAARVYAAVWARTDWR